MFWTTTLAAVLILLVVLVVFTIRTMQWGASLDEQNAVMPGDDYFGETDHFVVMTRALSVGAPPERVWPWIAQCGRGAGWYSYDRLDNGGRRSAGHLVPWIPPPQPGDASAIGYLKHIERGRTLTWWVPGLTWLGARVRAAFAMRVRPDADGTRLVIRMSFEASGAMARPALWLARFLDSVMARKQLLGIRDRAETQGTGLPHGESETGARDQYQLYEVIYASGERAGVPGRELAARWRRAAIDDGVLAPEPGAEFAGGCHAGYPGP